MGKVIDTMILFATEAIIAFDYLIFLNENQKGALLSRAPEMIGCASVLPT
nr:hypothetical protein PJ912_03640 [Pectobacterium colocasium]